ncbi:MULTISPECIES: hypothetical protein [Streptomyces]|uniref:hypothetical protein n=1 Tax=Streptomyces TaxID=1883 RepID=UPI0020599E2D|nr:MULTISPECIES: hypothetical protein [Streptomyces]UPT41767.1 hypothetical protein MWG59_10200 [Streptomyces sp. WAC00303]WIY75999.1 hypothetical protein QPM16_10060 [Streptomyces anulatus]
MASTRLNFVLDGRDALSRVLDRVGDNATRLHRRVSASTTNMSTSFNRLTQSATADGNALTRLLQRNGTAVTQYTTDANGRLRDLNGRFVSTGAATGGLTGALRRLVPSLGDASGGAEDLAKSGGKLGPVMGGVGAALGLSLLPALGAVVPMAAGAGLAMGTLTLGFSGVGEAAALAGEDKKKYAEALKKLSPEARSFTKELVKTKGEFSDFGKQIQKAMLPGFTKALKDAKPVIDIVGKGMTTMGKGFGDAAAGAGRLFKSGGFQKDLKTNLDLGMSFAREMTGGLGSLTRGLLDFGAKSGPTLRSFSTGLSGLLGKGGGGLVGMFKGLEPGIGGSAKLLDGLFGAVNRILPALGRLGGMAGKAFGPLFGELFEWSGKATSALMDGLGFAIKWLSPVFKDLSFGVKSVTSILSILAPTVKDTAAAIFGSFMPAFGEVDKAVGPLQRLSNTIKENKGAIQEFARQAGSAMITVAGAVIENMPTALAVFRMVTGGMVTAMGGVLHGAAKAFGWIPGIGDKLKSADRTFSSFKNSYISGLKSAEAKTREFAAGALPKLEQGRLKMNINNWTSQIETAKAKLKTLPADKQAKVRAEISDLQRKIASARATLSSLHDKVVTVTTRHVVVGGQARTSGSHGSQLKYAAGGLVGYPGGGMVSGPGTGTSDSILAQVSNGEFVVRAKSVAKYGARFLAAINEGRLGMASTMSGAGGSMAGAGAEAGRGLSAGLRASAAEVDGSARLMAAAVTAGVRAELEIASPSKKMKALMKDVGRGLILGLTGEKDKIKATAQDLVKDIWAAWKGVKTNKDSALVAMVNRDTGKLQKLATARDKIAATIAAANKYKNDLYRGAQQSAGLSSLGLQDEEVSAGSIQSGLQQKLAKITQFTRYVAGLAKKGLNKNLIKQVLDMGPDQGYAYASALAGMGSSALKAVNSTQSKLDKAALNLGSLGADVMYDSGRNSARGYLKGLDSQQDAIEKQMVKIAKSMDKAIRKALGIKSPSTVAAVSGGFFTKGVAKGAVDQLPVLDRAMGAVAGRMSGMRPVVGRPAFAGAGSGGGQVIHANITVQSLDPAAAAREVEKLLLKLSRSRGGTLTLKVG